MTAKTISSSGADNFLPSWRSATDPGDAHPSRTCDKDGTHHFSHVKKLALSGRQYIHAVNTVFEPNAAMRIGSAVHHLVLGPRKGKALVVYPGKTRQGKAWELFETEHPDAEILTASEWSHAETVADAVMSDPNSRPYLDGARYEVPLAWEENGLKFSTSGIDILPTAMLGDLKTSTTVEPAAMTRQVRRMHYAEQLVFYRRGCRIHGIDVSKGLFLLCVEVKAPYEVVPFELSERRIDQAERTVSLWLEKLKVFTESRQFPGYTQSAIVLDVEPWEVDDEDDDEDANP